MQVPEDATPRERELYAIIAELRANIAELKAELAKARKDSSNSSRPPSSDIVKPPKPPPPKGQKKRKRGGQPGHPRHERAAFPPEEVLTGTRFEDAVVELLRRLARLELRTWKIKLSISSWKAEFIAAMLRIAGDEVSSRLAAGHFAFHI